MINRKLTIRQLDRQLIPWLESRKLIQPKKGWVTYLRKALGMTLPQLAKKLNVGRSRIIKIQQAELSGHITMHTLSEVANALECDLVYAIVPRKPLQDTLQARAKKIAIQRLHRVSHSMALESQSVESVQQKEQLEVLINTLLTKSPKYLWEEEL